MYVVVYKRDVFNPFKTNKMSIKFETVMSEWSIVLSRDHRL